MYEYSINKIYVVPLILGTLGKLQELYTTIFKTYLFNVFFFLIISRYLHYIFKLYIIIFLLKKSDRHGKIRQAK